MQGAQAGLLVHRGQQRGGLPGEDVGLHDCGAKPARCQPLLRQRHRRRRVVDRHHFTARRCELGHLVTGATAGHGDRAGSRIDRALREPLLQLRIDATTVPGRRAGLEALLPELGVGAAGSS